MMTVCDTNMLDAKLLAVLPRAKFLDDWVIIPGEKGTTYLRRDKIMVACEILGDTNTPRRFDVYMDGDPSSPWTFEGSEATAFKRGFFPE